MQLELEKSKFKTEQTKLELEQCELHLIKEGKLIEGSSRESVGPSEPYWRFELGTKLKLMSKFNEKDPNMFFSLFERAADTYDWREAEHTLLL